MADFSRNFHPEEWTWDDGFGPLTVESVGPEEWRLVRPFIFTTRKGFKIKIPVGFVTDGASSLGFLITRWGGHYSTAATVHDYLYYCLNHGKPDPAATTRAQADEILYEAMTDAKPPVNFWVRYAIWAAVRGFGGPVLRKIGVR